MVRQTKLKRKSIVILALGNIRQEMNYDPQFQQSNIEGSQKVAIISRDSCCQQPNWRCCSLPSLS